MTKEKRLKGDAFEKSGSTLNTCVHAHGNNVEFFMKILTKNNYPLVQFHCIIKNNVPRFAFRMSRLLVGMCSAKTETLAVERRKVLKFFALSCYTNCLFCHKFFRSFGVPEVW